jgi:hypothetical protein
MKSANEEIYVNASGVDKPVQMTGTLNVPPHRAELKIWRTHFS